MGVILGYFCRRIHSHSKKCNRLQSHAHACTFRHFQMAVDVKSHLKRCKKVYACASTFCIQLPFFTMRMDSPAQSTQKLHPSPAIKCMYEYNCLKVLSARVLFAPNRIFDYREEIPHKKLPKNDTP